MRYKKFTTIVVSFFILVLFYCDVAFGIGAGGFRNEVVSAKGMGRGSANAAQTDDPAAVHYNPAAIVHLEDSQVSLGYTLEMPRAKCKPTSGGEVEMQAQDFFIPNFYLVDDFGLKDFSFGLGVTAPYGLGTDWADDSFSRYVSTGSDTEFYNINPTVAYQVNDKLSVGLGMDYMRTDVDKFKKVNVSATNVTLQGLGYPAATVETDGDFNLKGDDEGWGYNLGILCRLSEEHTFGISYRSEVDFTYKGTVAMNNLGSGNTATVFGGSSYETDIESKLTLPESLAIGYAYKPNNRLTLELDVEWTGWSSVVQEWIEWQTETNAVRLAILNDGNPASKDWDDVFSFAIGVNYEATDLLELRCGYVFEETPIPEANFNTALPDADRHGISCGLGYAFKDVDIDISYLALFFADRDIRNSVGSSSNADIDGKYEQFVNIFSVGFTYKY